MAFNNNLVFKSFYFASMLVHRIEFSLVTKRYHIDKHTFKCSCHFRFSTEISFSFWYSPPHILSESSYKDVCTIFGCFFYKNYLYIQQHCFIVGVHSHFLCEDKRADYTLNELLLCIYCTLLLIALLANDVGCLQSK